MVSIRSGRVLFGFGANAKGLWGGPRTAIIEALAALEKAGVRIQRVSPAVLTAPISHIRQPAYVNLVAEAAPGMPPAGLLRLAKRLEHQAGRRSRGLGSARPLDIDILDYGGRRLGRNAPGRRPKAQLILPHPLAARRGFVLVPLATLDPGWRPAGRGETALAILARRPELRRGIAWTELEPRPERPASPAKVGGRPLPLPSVRGRWTGMRGPRCR